MSEQTKTETASRFDWPLLLLVTSIAVATFTAIDLATSIAYGHEDSGAAVWAGVRIWFGVMFAGTGFLIAFGLRRHRRG